MWLPRLRRRANPEASEAQLAASAAASSSAFASLNHASFSLVDDMTCRKAIESSRLLQQVLPAVDHILAELNKLISTVQGLPNVRAELNPLRPEVFAQTLREMIGQQGRAGQCLAVAQIHGRAAGARTQAAL
jgi:hypothetical protein